MKNPRISLLFLWRRKTCTPERGLFLGAALSWAFWREQKVPCIRAEASSIRVYTKVPHGTPKNPWDWNSCRCEQKLLEFTQTLHAYIGVVNVGIHGVFGLCPRLQELIFDLCYPFKLGGI